MGALQPHHKAIALFVLLLKAVRFVETTNLALRGGLEDSKGEFPARRLLPEAK